MKTIIEKRAFLTTEYADAIEIRTEGDEKILTGISPPWDSWSVDLGGFREKFAPTAFDGIIDRKPKDPRGIVDVPFLTDHLSHLNTGRTTNKRLELTKGLRGLEFKHRPLLTTAGRDLILMVEDRTITGSSFAFTTAPDGETWTEDEKGNVTRTVFKASGIYDISAVTYPAYPKSEIGARGIALWREARGLVMNRDEGKKVTIALDFDTTFVASPGLWRSLIVDATQRGDEVILLSSVLERERVTEEIRQLTEGLSARAVFIGEGESKRSAVTAAGIVVDAWIDPQGGEEKPPILRTSTLVGARAAAAAAQARMRIAVG